ncbi:MAG: hypothetical protein ACFCVD_07785 [Nodosilinea sp.]
MKSALRIANIGLASLGLLATATAAQAEPPAVYYSWRATDITATACITQAGQALASQNLTPIQADATSVAGRSEVATAVFVCLENSDATTVMVIVAGADDDQTLALREALKVAF